MFLEIYQGHLPAYTRTKEALQEQRTEMDRCWNLVPLEERLPFLFPLRPPTSQIQRLLEAGVVRLIAPHQADTEVLLPQIERPDYETPTSFKILLHGLPGRAYDIIADCGRLTAGGQQWFTTWDWTTPSQWFRGVVDKILLDPGDYTCAAYVCGPLQGIVIASTRVP